VVLYFGGTLGMSIRPGHWEVRHVPYGRQLDDLPWAVL
jgi:hypothetical protein